MNALDRLPERLDRHLATPDDQQLRDGLIQRFAFTYELSHRMLRRYPRMIGAQVAAASPDFLIEAQFLRDALVRRVA